MAIGGSRDGSLAVPVAVVDDDPKLRTRLAVQLGDAARAAAYASLDVLEERGLAASAFVLVLGPSFASPERLRHLSRVRRGREVSAVMVVEELSTELLQQAMRAGVSDVITLPADTETLLEAVERAAANLDLGVARPVGDEPAESPRDEGRVIAVFAPKGGAGKSVLSTNLAVALARRSSQPVAIVDCDLQFGDVAVMLQLVPQQTMMSVVAAGERLDAEQLRSSLVTHEPSGVLVLPAPTDPAQADQVHLAHVLRVLALLRQQCAYVIVDTPAQFNDVVLGVLEDADDIVLVGGMDIPHVKNTKIALQTLRLLNIPADKVKLVLNRANSKVRLDVAEVERTLAMRADVSVPSDIVVPQSVNKGVPVVLDAPRSGVARAIERLAELFPADVTRGQVR